MSRRRSIALFAAAAGTFLVGTNGPASAHEPTCGGLGGIAVHGQHVVGDYVIGGSGLGSGLEWPYNGLVGETVSANGGAAVPGGPGPGFHFPNGFAPGASFCTGSNSPGVHV
jgi:hypothetical protein